MDGSGNIFVADSGNNAVKEILAAGGYTTVNTLGSGFSSPTGVALNASGDVFVADTGNNAVKEILAAGGYTTVNTLASVFNHPQGVAVDGIGWWNCKRHRRPRPIPSPLLRPQFRLPPGVRGR